MHLLIPSFLAGTLTILAPCVITLMPIILGGTLGTRNPWRPLVITVSLGISIMIFTLLLRATTAFIDIPTMFWQSISGGLILFFGITLFFPGFWNFLSLKLGLHHSERLLQKSSAKHGFGGTILLGASLGPVFTTCSPTYALILATVLPASFAIGFVNMIAFTLGLMIPMLIIGYGGQAIAKHLRFAVNPRGWFKKILGLILIATGVLILTGYDKVLETKILDSGYLGPIEIEQSLLEKAEL